MERLNRDGYRQRIDKNKWITPHANFIGIVGRATTGKGFDKKEFDTYVTRDPSDPPILFKFRELKNPLSPRDQIKIIFSER